MTAPATHRLVRVGGDVLLAARFGLPAVQHDLLDAGRVLFSHDPAQTHAWASQGASDDSGLDADAGGL